MVEVGGGVNSRANSALARQARAGGKGAGPRKVLQNFQVYLGAQAPTPPIWTTLKVLGLFIFFFFNVKALEINNFILFL